MKSEAILDCESYDSILKSLEVIFATDRSVILDYIRNFKIQDYFSSGLAPISFLYNEFNSRFTPQVEEFSAFCFHITRVPRHFDFSEGILPLDQAMPRIENMINDIASRLGLPINNLDLLNSNEIRQKIETNGRGPWFFLIQPGVSDIDNINHKYFQAPELVVDILRLRYNSSCEKILKKYREETSSCIIKFKNPHLFLVDDLAYIVFYIYQKEHKIELIDEAYRPKSFEGRRIERELIKTITFFDSITRKSSSLT